MMADIPTSNNPPKVHTISPFTVDDLTLLAYLLAHGKSHDLLDVLDAHVLFSLLIGDGDGTTQSGKARSAKA